MRLKVSKPSGDELVEVLRTGVYKRIKYFIRRLDSYYLTSEYFTGRKIGAGKTMAESEQDAFKELDRFIALYGSHVEVIKRIRRCHKTINSRKINHD